MIRVPLYAKLMTPLVALLILLVALTGFRLYQQADARLQADLDARLQQTAEYLAQNVDTDSLQQVQSPADRNGPAYATVEAQLELARQAGGLAWVGIYRREGSYLYYWVDADSTGVGYPFFHATPDHFAVFDQQAARRLQYEDEFGSYYGYGAPIIVQGRVIGMVEASVSGETRRLVEKTALENALPILVLAVAGGIVASLLVTYIFFSRPLQRLQAGAQHLASGQFGYQIAAVSHDELGDLAETFNRMSTQIERLYFEKVREERARREREITQLRESENVLESRVVERTAELAAANQELIESQAALSAARDQALDASGAKSAFLARMSHELRTPLTVIIGYVEIMEALVGRGLTEELKEPLDQVRMSAHRILEQVNEVLDMSKIEAGKMELYIEDVSLPALIKDIVGTVPPLINRNNNQLAVEGAAGLGVMRGDPTKIRQSLLNLISNASKYTQDGLITLRTRRETDAEGREWVVFQVVDTGAGIPPDKLGGLFQEFSQAHGATSGRLGTGLGLALTQRFVDLMGGTISAESEGPGHGSTFTIRLPARPCEEK